MTEREGLKSALEAGPKSIAGTASSMTGQIEVGA